MGQVGEFLKSRARQTPPRVLAALERFNGEEQEQ
jgi:hypothetical protein